MFWRKRSSTKEKDYEKLLEDLDTEIKKAEDNLRQIKIREDKSIVTWLYYSIPIYSLLCIFYSFFLYRSGNPWPILCLHASPLLLGLLVIIFVRKFISIWYKKQQITEEEKNTELKKQQKEILEELKNKLKYYQTKNLIEKYELQEQPLFDFNGMPMTYPQMNQRMDSNQLRHKRSMIDPRKQQVMNSHTISKQRSMPVLPKNKNNKQFPDSNQQQPQQQQQQQQQQHPLPPLTSPSNPNERKWIDKLMDAIVGDVNEVDSKYALVCNFCYTHCGLALPEEYKTFKYICPNCKKLNDNALKYNVKVPNSNKRPGNLLPPVSIPNRVLNTQSAPTTPLKEINKSDIFDAKPNLMRRSSTLLEEMDDSTNNTDSASLSQSIPAQENEIVESNDAITEGTEEGLEQSDNNNIEQYDQEIEQEKEIINLPEEKNNDNDNKLEEENNKIQNKVTYNDNDKEESSTEQPVVEKNEPVIEEDSQQ